MRYGESIVTAPRSGLCSPYTLYLQHDCYDQCAYMRIPARVSTRAYAPRERVNRLQMHLPRFQSTCIHEIEDRPHHEVSHVPIVKVTRRRSTVRDVSDVDMLKIAVSGTC